MILVAPIFTSPITINPSLVNQLAVDMIRCATCGPDLSSTIQQQGSTP
jgi:hypothetical protein